MTKYVTTQATQSEGSVGRTASRYVSLWTSSVALLVSLIAIAVGATSPLVVCPPNYVQLVELAPVSVISASIVAVFALITLLTAIPNGKTVLLAVVSSILAGLGLSILVLAIVVHEGHLSNCWTF